MPAARKAISTRSRKECTAPVPTAWSAGSSAASIIRIARTWSTAAPHRGHRGEVVDLVGSVALDDPREAVDVAQVVLDHLHVLQVRRHREPARAARPDGADHVAALGEEEPGEQHAVLSGDPGDQ